jgi:hypothetical protein
VQECFSKPHAHWHEVLKKLVGNVIRSIVSCGALKWPNVKTIQTNVVYTTIFNSDGGGGNSLMPVSSFPLSSTLVDVTPIDADTQVKNLEMVLLSAVSRLTTFSVICFSRFASAPLPAAQATV